MIAGNDPWLQRWLSMLAARSADARILELGCASGHPEIEPDYYLVDGEPKRFFDRVAVERLFAGGWRRISREEMLIERYDHPKAAWEVVLESAG